MTIQRDTRRPTLLQHLRSRAKPVLALGGLLCLGLLIAAKPPAPVTMTNDHLGSSVFRAPAADRSGRLAGEVTLGNSGWLPFAYSLGVSEALPGEHLEIRRHGDRKLLYSGPPSQEQVELGHLSPGQSVRLDLLLTGTGNVRALGLEWTAHGSLAGYFERE